MKRKVITILLMCALSVNFTACGNSSSENNVSSKESEEKKEAPADNAEISEPETSNPEDSSQETDDSKEDEKTQSEESDNPQPEEETQPEEPPYEMNTSAALKDWNITVTDAQIVDSISSGYIVFSPNEEGNKFIQVYATDMIMIYTIPTLIRCLPKQVKLLLKFPAQLRILQMNY